MRPVEGDGSALSHLTIAWTENRLILQEEQEEQAGKEGIKGFIMADIL